MKNWNLGATRLDFAEICLTCPTVIGSLIYGDGVEVKKKIPSKIDPFILQVLDREHEGCMRCSPCMYNEYARYVCYIYKTIP